MSFNISHFEGVEEYNIIHKRYPRIQKKTVNIMVDTNNKEIQFKKVLSLSKNTCIIKILFQPNTDYGLDIKSTFFHTFCQRELGIKDIGIYEVFEQTYIKSENNHITLLGAGLWISYIVTEPSRDFKLTIYFID